MEVKCIFQHSLTYLFFVFKAALSGLWSQTRQHVKPIDSKRNLANTTYSTLINMAGLCGLGNAVLWKNFAHVDIVLSTLHILADWDGRMFLYHQIYR